MLTGTYRDLFIVIATASASLIGLLFVAVTVRQNRSAKGRSGVVQEVRAAAALLSFSNALAVSLFSLVPGTNVGYPAVVVGVIGLLFSAAGTRSFLAGHSPQSRQWRHLGLTIVLFLFFVWQLVDGIKLLQDPRNTGPLAGISYILVASLLIGIARAWELVGGRDTGIIASLAVLIGHDASTQGSAVRPGASTPKEPTGPELRSEDDGTS